MNETVRNNNREIRTMVNEKVFGAFCKYVHDTGLNKNVVSRMAITKYLREEGYLTLKHESEPTQ